MSPRKQITYSQHPNHAARSAHAKGEKAFRTYDTSYIRPKRNPLPAIIAIIILIAVLVGVVFAVLNLTRSCSQANLVPEGTEVEITIVEGEGAKSVGKTLQDVGLIANSNEFTDRLVALGAENSLQPGTYKLVGGQSVDDIIKILQTPVQAETFTVPEGCTIRQTAEIVSDATNGHISVNDFLKAAGNASAYAGDYPFLTEAAGSSLEGYLFPKTYPISAESTADSVIRTMLDQFEVETATLDYSIPSAYGLSQYDVVKLASIVEGESNGEERATLASVFYNRLINGMTLGADATVKYFVGHEPTAEDIETENPYNTYKIQGLTPTPINSPGIESLLAVCNPEDTNYLYFYHDETGHAHFSETYEEHRSTYE